MIGWRAISSRAGRNDLPYLMFTNWHALVVEDKPTAVMESWVSPEWPEKAAERDLWLMAFDEVGYMVDGEVMDPADDPDLPPLVTLWRGATPERRDGMSWTLDQDRAVWFANRFGGLESGATAVFRIAIPREYVLARFTGRGENEVVVDTSEFDEEEYERIDVSEAALLDTCQ